MVIDKVLKLLPQRPVDGSFVLRNRDSADGQNPRRVYRLNVRTDKVPVLMRRSTGLEKVYRIRCTRCDLQLGVETVDPQLIKEKGEKARGEFTYLLEGALTQTQAALPENAFEERLGVQLLEA